MGLLKEGFYRGRIQTFIKGLWLAGAGVTEWGHTDDVSGYIGSNLESNTDTEMLLDEMMPKESKKNKTASSFSHFSLPVSFERPLLAEPARIQLAKKKYMQKPSQPHRVEYREWVWSQDIKA